MRNKLLVVGVVGALGLGLAACGGDDDDDASGSATEADAGDDAGSGATADVAVRIEGFAFEDIGPVAAGATFAVENADSATHTFTADDGAFNESVGGGETITVTAPSEPGEYPYRCEIHTSMTGTLVVE